ncbi:hypothetical protein M0811_09492 [Anaeramoeba ignava]|uniref:Uncharacterized protein n=1 Tax=Anaeramoeba ignava TaxID=1746090 RepID=A0A9Q0LFX5_ANAIG|nr:hypothetical protein M0811_09492 [Anaeramoeba ignava]|eukprot:Anaeramoba_ignava/a1413_194.p1 GENE.a1413_194~~a1413_194.p1  ORF type:complete len:203 (-),score=58.52 a1413_194:42-614(-)
MKSIKCVIIGDYLVGKAQTLFSYVREMFPGEYMPTIFENYVENMKIDETEVRLSLWDTTGQEDYDKLRTLSYLKTDVFIICFSFFLPSSFENVKQKWVPEINHFCPHAPIILLGSSFSFSDDKNDLPDFSENSHIISHKQAVELANDINAVKYLECFSLSQNSLKIVFDEAIRAVLDEKSERKRKSCFIL